MKMIYVTGDTHGDFGPLRKKMSDLGIGAGDTMVVLGDNGLNFHYGWKDKNKKKAAIKNFDGTYFIVRGNHDIDPSDYFRFPHAGNISGNLSMPNAHWEIYFDNLVLVENEFPQIKYAVDGFIYTIDGKECLIIGGGYSVDKFLRLENGWKWVPNEMLDEFELEDIYETYCNNHVDVILSHVAPVSFEPWLKHLWGDGNKGGWPIIDKSMEVWMNKLLWNECNDIKLWYYGHYHGNFNTGDIGVAMFDEILPFGERFSDSD